MRRILACIFCMWLGGCGFVSSSIIKADSLAFNDVIEDASNKLLVLNILRARDKAPLYFADIPVIRESMQQNATLSAIEFSGPIAGTGSRNSRTGGIGFGFTPSFEVTHLHSKEFHTGMATPIDAKFVKYWLDRGLDRRIVLLLFFSAAEIVERRSEKSPVTTIRIMNSPRDAVDVITRRRGAQAGAEAVRCDTQSDFALPEAHQHAQDLLCTHLPRAPAARERPQSRAGQGQPRPAVLRRARPEQDPARARQGSARL